MLLVTSINILTGPNTLTVLLEYINLFQSQAMAIQSKYQGGVAYPWPHTILYLNLIINQVSMFCLNLFLLAMLSILLFAFIFLLLFYNKIGHSSWRTRLSSHTSYYDYDLIQGKGNSCKPTQYIVASFCLTVSVCVAF